MHFNISHDAKRRSIVYVHAKLSLCIIYVTYEFCKYYNTVCNASANIMVT